MTDHSTADGTVFLAVWYSSAALMWLSVPGAPWWFWVYTTVVTAALVPFVSLEHKAYLARRKAAKMEALTMEVGKYVQAPGWRIASGPPTCSGSVFVGTSGPARSWTATVAESERLIALHCTSLPVEPTTEPPTGYRGWKIVRTDDGPKLKSLIAQYEWEGPVQSNEEPPPDRIDVFKPYEGLGFFAAKDAGAVRANYSNVDATGTLDLFGAVVEHKRGWRAQGVRVRSLVMQAGRWQRTIKIRVEGRVTDVTCGVEVDESLMDAHAVFEFKGATSAEILESEIGRSWDTSTVDRDETEAVRRALEERYQCDVTIEETEAWTSASQSEG